MAKHRRYSRKRSLRRKRGSSMKMRGGINTPTNGDMSIDFETAIPPGSPGQNSEANMSLNMSNISEPGEALNMSDLNITPNSDEGNTSIESNLSVNSQQSFDTNGSNLDISNIQGDEDEVNYVELDEPGNLFSDDEYMDENTSMESATGGKRKRRTSKRRSTKRRTNKRKTKKSKKSKKTRKHRRRRHHGGADTFTETTQEMDPYDNPNDNKEAEMLARGLFNSK